MTCILPNLLKGRGDSDLTQFFQPLHRRFQSLFFFGKTKPDDFVIMR
jgi:hypothetical protein